jgi:hypothetical protein
MWRKHDKALPCILSIVEEPIHLIPYQWAYPLTVCGHVYWPLPFAEQSRGNQFLNVDSRVIILMPHQ